MWLHPVARLVFSLVACHPSLKKVMIGCNICFMLSKKCWTVWGIVLNRRVLNSPHVLNEGHEIDAASR